jgi:hypothetical protein
VIAAPLITKLVAFVIDDTVLPTAPVEVVPSAVTSTSITMPTLSFAVDTTTTVVEADVVPQTVNTPEPSPYN